MITLFTWLTNLGAFGLVLLLVLVSVAVIGFFRRDQRGVGSGSRLVAPIIAFVALAIVWVLILLNWDVLLGQPESTPTTFILPAVLLVPSALAVVWALWLRKARPDVYRQIGHGTELPEAPLLGEPAVEATKGNL
ncbi:MAG: amino acid permease [Microbacterium sp.]|nr:amino acid permease [Microbacterium sp.]